MDVQGNWAGSLFLRGTDLLDLLGHETRKTNETGRLVDLFKREKREKYVFFNKL